MPVDMQEYYKIFNHYINVDILEANPELSKATISDVNIRTIKEEKKVAISFKENSKEFVLNKTNKNTLTNAFGDNPTTTWVGKSIKLQIADVEFNGNIIKGIRIAIPEVEKKEEPKIEKKVDIKKEEPKIEKKEQPKEEIKVEERKQIKVEKEQPKNWKDWTDADYKREGDNHYMETGIEYTIEEIKEFYKKKEEKEKKEKVEKKVEEEIVVDSMINEIAKTRVCAICKKPKGDKEADLSNDGTEFVHSDCHKMQGMEEQAVNQYMEPEQNNDIKKEEPKICILCKKPTTDGTMFADHPAHQECVDKLPMSR